MVLDGAKHAGGGDMRGGTKVVRVRVRVRDGEAGRETDISI